MCEKADKFLFMTLEQMLNRKMTYQLLKSIKEYSSQFGLKISKYLNYFFCSFVVNSKTVDYEQFYLLYPFFT